MTDIPSRLALLNSTVTQTLPNMHTQYMTMVRASRQLREQNSALQEEVRTLETKHASLQAVADTYDREFLDRDRPAPSFWSRRGVQTFQDWLLASFFFMYAVVCVGLLLYTLRYSTKKLQAAAIVMGVSITLGVMLAGLIMRLA